MAKVVIQKWEESERGWGTRPDGYSVHLTDADRQAFIDAYWASMPDAVPDEYDRPDGVPYLADATHETLARLHEFRAAGVYGVRMYTNTYPGHGGRSGWVKQDPLYDGGLA